MLKEIMDIPSIFGPFWPIAKGTLVLFKFNMGSRKEMALKLRIIKFFILLAVLAPILAMSICLCFHIEKAKVCGKIIFNYKGTQWCIQRGLKGTLYCGMFV